MSTDPPATHTDRRSRRRDGPPRLSLSSCYRPLALPTTLLPYTVLGSTCFAKDRERVRCPDVAHSCETFGGPFRLVRRRLTAPVRQESSVVGRLPRGDVRL